MKDQYQQAADQARRAIYAFRQADAVAGVQHRHLRKEVQTATDIETHVWGTPKDAFGETFDKELPSYMLRNPFGGANRDEWLRRTAFVLEDYTKLPKALQPLEGETPNQWLSRLHSEAHDDIMQQYFSNVFGKKTPEEEAEMRKRQEGPHFFFNEETLEDDPRKEQSKALRKEYMPTTRDTDPGAV